MVFSKSNKKAASIRMLSNKGLLFLNDNKEN